MRKLYNTLYITNEKSYLHKSGENIVIKIEEDEVARFPIHIIEAIVCFNYVGISPALMGLCMENNVYISFLSPQGKFLGRMHGKKNGNVLLRRRQYRIADNIEESLPLSKLFIISKIVNSSIILKRGINDHKEVVNIEKILQVIENLKKSINKVDLIMSEETLLGIEGEAAKNYFSVFNELILKNKDTFNFEERSKRPPMDRINAMLSFGYSLLTYDMQSAIETVGLDSFVGFFHKDRPGRASLSLDMIEELRAYIVDRFVLSLVNRNQIKDNHFEIKENGAVLLNEKGRKEFLTLWQKRKKETLTHPYLDEKIEYGLLPYVQAMLMARYIRGDLEMYPPFFIKR